MVNIHSQGINHLDLKPQNVMIVGRGETLGVKIIDFLFQTVRQRMVEVYHYLKE